MSKPRIEDWLGDEALSTLTDWAQSGDGEAALAARMGIAPQTLRRWALREPRIRQAIAKDALDARLEAALISRAVGFTVVERRTNSRTAEVVETEKFVPPDIRALTFMLVNRAPERWKIKGGQPKPPKIGGSDPLVSALKESAELVFEGEAGGA